MYSSLDIIRKYKAIVRKVAKTLSNERFKHTIRVAILAGELASIHHEDMDKAVLAALVHDYAREKKNDELLALAQQGNWPIHAVEKSHPMLLHGPVAAFLAREEWGIKDTDVLEAVTYHTTGHPQMNPIAKVLYVADMVEPGRDYSGVEELRNQAFVDLKVSLLACLDHSIRYLLSEGAMIHPLSVETRSKLINNKCTQKGEV